MAVAAWVASVPGEIAREGSGQIAIDHLLEPPLTLAVAAALRCLSQALAAVRTPVPAADGLVAVPLPWSNHLVTECPTLADVLAEPWTYGPGCEVPGVYAQTSTGWLDADEAGGTHLAFARRTSLAPPHAGRLRAGRGYRPPTVRASASLALGAGARPARHPR